MAASVSPFGMQRSRIRGASRALRKMRGPRDPPVVASQITTHDKALAGDLVFAERLAVLAATHLDGRHDFPQLSVAFDVPQRNQVIGKERYDVGVNRRSS